MVLIRYGTIQYLHSSINMDTKCLIFAENRIDCCGNFKGVFD